MPILLLQGQRDPEVFEKENSLFELKGDMLLPVQSRTQIVFFEKELCPLTHPAKGLPFTNPQAYFRLLILVSGVHSVEYILLPLLGGLSLSGMVHSMARTSYRRWIAEGRERKSNEGSIH